jgi:hypothetical protein
MTRAPEDSLRCSGDVKELRGECAPPRLNASMNNGDALKLPPNDEPLKDPFNESAQRMQHFSDDVLHNSQGTV